MRILLVCAGGISTSFLVQNMKKAMAAQGVAGEVHAKAITEAPELITQVDVILIAPQAQFLKEKVAKLCAEHGVPWAVIDQMHYGAMDGEKVVTQAFNLISKEVQRPK